MTDPGARLRQARESRGITLEQAEEATHIRRSLLEALEEGRFEELPAGVYGRGLIRNYASYLGLDPDASAEEFSRYVVEPEPYEPQVLDEPLTPARHVPGRAAWVGVLLLVAVVGWYVYRILISGSGPGIPGLQPSRANTAVATAPVLETAIPGRTETITGAVGGEAEPGLTVTTAASGPATRTPTGRPSPTARLRPTATSSPTAIAGVVVEATAQADTYVEATVDGERVYAGILHPDESMRWQAERVIALRVGNAGGLRLVVNGVEVGSLGASGQVVNVEYNVENLPGR